MFGSRDHLPNRDFGFSFIEEVMSEGCRQAGKAHLVDPNRTGEGMALQAADQVAFTDDYTGLSPPSSLSPEKNTSPTPAAMLSWGVGS